MKDVVEELADAVRQLAGRQDVCDAVDALYADLQREIDLRRPVCSISGKCCRFEAYGHRLYVTTMELVRFARDLPETGTASSATVWDGTGCLFQIGGRCGVHSIRPFGCRIFFCDATSTDWQQTWYERLHARFRTLHDAINVPYFYVEWRAALRAIGITPARAQIL